MPNLFKYARDNFPMEFDKSENQIDPEEVIRKLKKILQYLQTKKEKRQVNNEEKLPNSSVH